MKRNGKLYLKLFLSTFQLSAFTFGGGYVIVSLMKKKFVEKYKWIDEREMLDMVAIAQSSPGAIAVNTSILLGYKIAGVLGALMTIIGTILPPLIIISIISLFYAKFRDNAIVSALLLGMQAGVAAVIISTVTDLIGGVLKEKKIFSIIIMIVAFVAVFFLKVNVALIIVAAALIGLGTFFYKKHKEKKAPEVKDDNS